MRILVGTEDGLREFDAGGRPGPHHHAGRSVTALGAEYPHTWVILDGSHVLRTGDSGAWLEKGSLEGLQANCIADTRAGYVIGTSEAHLYRVVEDGLELVTSFDDVEGRAEWYTPWGGPPDSRSISEDHETVYVNVHVGGIVRTRDEGATWEPTIDIDADVHRVLALDRRVFAACASGLAVSEDRGDSWIFRIDGLDATYCRGIGVCGETVLVSASSGPHGGNSAVYRGLQSGGRLERCRKGLPESFDDNIDSLCLDAVPDEGFAAFGTADGRLFASDDQGATWAEAASDLPAIRSVLLMP
ncbi:MAG TPA: hypothetical protein VGR41_08935 [Actinomycetota bacterium]|jgi:hypothetical protein|nr:hypothetical protein [Actinomycetota bacterium]